MFGDIKYTPEVYSTHEKIVSAGLRQAVNFPIQSGAAVILKYAMIALTPVCEKWDKRGIIARPILQVHDELIFEVEDGMVEEAIGIIRPIMATTTKLSIPTPVDVEVGRNWYELEEWKGEG